MLYVYKCESMPFEEKENRWEINQKSKSISMWRLLIAAHNLRCGPQKGKASCAAYAFREIHQSITTYKSRVQGHYESSVWWVSYIYKTFFVKIIYFYEKLLDVYVYIYACRCVHKYVYSVYMCVYICIKIKIYKYINI